MSRRGPRILHNADVHFAIYPPMTQSVTRSPGITYPTPLITAEALDTHVLRFIADNPQGVRNSQVGRAIGYNDTRQWFSYGVLERLIREGKVRKDDFSRYFITP